MRFWCSSVHKSVLAIAFVFASISVALACSSVTGVSPASGPAAGGTAVTITGDGFRCKTIAVTFGGNPATSFNVESDTEITATVPPGTGTVDVTVVIDGTPHTLSGGYSYISPDDDSQNSQDSENSQNNQNARDSRNVRSLQNAVGKTAAAISGQTITNQIDGAITAAFDGSSAPVAGSATGLTFNFTAERRSPASARAEQAFAALGAASGAGRLRADETPVVMRDWNAWLDLRGSGFQSSAANADLHGGQYNVTGGLGHFLTPDLLIGVVVGYEHMKYDSTALAGSIRSDGGNLGSYFGWRLSPTLRFDAALSYGRIAYSAVAGAAGGSFSGNRWVASTGLVGTHQFGNVVIEPSARIYGLWEKQADWTDSVGTLQAERTFSAGRISTGGKVMQPLPYRDVQIMPYVGFYGDYRFSSDNALPAGSPIVGIGDGWSGRVTSGISFAHRLGMSVSLGGEYAGIGGIYKVWSGNARVSVPF
jgi:hypothetical protein